MSSPLRPGPCCLCGPVKPFLGTMHKELSAGLVKGPLAGVDLARQYYLRGVLQSPSSPATFDFVILTISP